MTQRLMLDLTGTKLSGEEREILKHPMAGGVVLFARNYENTEQLYQLTRSIRSVNPLLLIATDHEGGRVQRFIKEFSALPSANELGKRHDQDPEDGLESTYKTGRLIARELASVGIDFSLAPVLDLDWGKSTVIGDRSFHADPKKVVALAKSFCTGLRSLGMQPMGKHFPGHGYATADSHNEQAVDRRAYETMKKADLIPFAEMIKNDLPGIMTAHVCYPRIDKHAATFSRRWLKDELRKKLHFKGLVMSDDLSMAGAAQEYPDPLLRARRAIDSGCDMIVVCNDRPSVLKILGELKARPIPSERLDGMRNKVMR